MQEGKKGKENERKDNEWNPATSNSSHAYSPSCIKALRWGSRSKGGKVGRLWNKYSCF